MKLPLPILLGASLLCRGIESRRHKVGGAVLVGLILAIPTLYFIAMGWPG